MTDTPSRDSDDRVEGRGGKKAVLESSTVRIHQAVVLAQEESRLLNHPFVGTEHLLLGLIREETGVAGRVLKQLGISLEMARERTEELLGASGGPPVGSPPFTPRAREVLELAGEEAVQLGHYRVEPEHVLVSLVHEGQGVGAQVLLSLGADLTAVRQQVIEALNE